MSEVDGGTHPDLKDTPLSQWDDPSTNVFDRFRISQRTHEMRIDMVSVERHTCSMRCAHSLADPIAPALRSAKKISLVSCL
jgi:hypothetical protein